MIVTGKNSFKYLFKTGFACWGMETVYILQNSRKLDKRAFLSYLSDKIKKTAKKFGTKKTQEVFRVIRMRSHSDMKKPSKKVFCLDDAAIEIIYSLMAHKTPKLKKSEFLHCLKKELEIYARLRGKKFDFIEYSGLRLKVSKMLDFLEKQHPEIKYSILAAHSQA
jgi:Lhr-like helicase